MATFRPRLAFLPRGTAVAVAYQTSSGIRVTNGRLVRIDNSPFGPPSVVIRQGYRFLIPTGIVVRTVRIPNVVSIRRLPY